MTVFDPFRIDMRCSFLHMVQHQIDHHLASGLFLIACLVCPVKSITLRRGNWHVHRVVHGLEVTGMIMLHQVIGPLLHREDECDNDAHA